MDTPDCSSESLCSSFIGSERGDITLPRTSFSIFEFNTNFLGFGAQFVRVRPSTFVKSLALGAIL